jgi:spermidine synthase
MALGFATDDPARRRVTADELRARGVPAGLRYYTPEVHVGAFAHPAWMAGRVGY